MKKSLKLSMYLLSELDLDSALESGGLLHLLLKLITEKHSYIRNHILSLLHWYDSTSEMAHNDSKIRFMSHSYTLPSIPSICYVKWDSVCFPVRAGQTFVHT